MTNTKSLHDDVTGRQLKLRIGLVVVLAAVAAVLTTWPAVADAELKFPGPLSLITLCAAVVVAYHFHIWVRIHDNRNGSTWSEVPVLVGLAFLPAPWVVLCAAVGVAIYKTAIRLPRHRIVFGVAKEVITAATAATVFALCDGRIGAGEANIVAAVVAFVAMTIVDDLVYLPVVSVASGTTVARMVAKDWDIKLLGQAVRFAVVVLLVTILALDSSRRLLFAVPPLIFCLHLWLSHRMRTRAERESWQQLSMTIDELSVVDLGTLLYSGVTGAARLFRASQVEIDLSGEGHDRVVQGNVDGLTGDARHDESTPADARPGDVVIPLITQDGSYDVGVLRLRIGGALQLNEFENYKLKTFGSALCTAIRNASAYAELERISGEHAYAAAHDPLTGLANRRELLEQADRMFTERLDEGMLALLLIDLNHFKEVNDTLGHAAGDKVLIEVAMRLQVAAHPDDLVARLGGDEFAVLLTGLPTPAMATHRAESMLATLERSIEVDGMRLSIEACGGIALAPGSGGVTELLRRADVAMYEAKRSGQRTANYVHSRDTADVDRLMLGGEVRRAMAEQKFVVDFQPIVDLATGEVISAEALPRWHHPDHGKLTALQFRETIERSGQLAAFVDAVLVQALDAVNRWQEGGFDVPVAVNVSPRSLLDPAFPDAVLSRLAEHGVEAEWLVLELAETLTISQLDVVQLALSTLRDAGVRLALDDFGTGVSSLSVLSRIPVHQLKIGREFVVAVETSSEAAAVIRSTVDLARSLHLTVVAEGVESEPQRYALWELGCVAGQGHLFARPMRAGRMLAALQRGSGGRPGVLADALHDAGSVVRMSRRRTPGHGRSNLPHLPA